MRVAYQRQGVPLSVLIDRHGVVRRTVFGVRAGRSAHVTEWTTPAGRAAIARLLDER